jgi:hypothetical protein
LLLICRSVPLAARALLALLVLNVAPEATAIPLAASRVASGTRTRVERRVLAVLVIWILQAGQGFGLMTRKLRGRSPPTAHGEATLKPQDCHRFSPR